MLSVFTLPAPSPLNNSGSSGTTTPHQLLNNSGVPSPRPLNNNNNGNSGTPVSHLLNSSVTLNNNNGNGGAMTLSSGATAALHSLNNSVATNIHQLNNNGGNGGAMTLNSGATNIHQLNNNGGATNPPPLGNSLSEAQLSGGEAQKLRNLLTHGGGDSDSLSKDIKMEGVVENGFNGGGDHHGNDNLILRELLNQEDEDDKDGLAEICGDSLQKRAALGNSNNMLRKVCGFVASPSLSRAWKSLCDVLPSASRKLKINLCFFLRKASFFWRAVPVVSRLKTKPL